MRVFHTPTFLDETISACGAGERAADWPIHLKFAREWSALHPLLGSAWRDALEGLAPPGRILRYCQICWSNGNIPPKRDFSSSKVMRHSSNHGAGQEADDGILAIAVNMIAAPRKAATDFMEGTSPMFLESIGALAATVVLTLLFVLNAAWLSGISLLSNDGIGFRNWFSMICWCALPLVFGYAASLVNILVSHATPRYRSLAQSCM